jgi:ring-1,2-phenylacetyl-CoA epoxidase subunit PaaA
MADVAKPSARSLLLTVFGDVVLPSGGAAWLPTLTQAMEDLGVAPATTRQALRRLTTQGIVTPERLGRNASYHLTGAGLRRLEEAADRIYLRRRLVWDGRWRMLTYSFPEDERGTRAALRKELAWLGYGSLASGMWVCPWDLGSRRDAVLAKHDVAGSVQSFTAALEGDDRDLAARAYDLGELTEAHRGFLDTYETGEIWGGTDDRDAFAARIRLVHHWRKFLFLDPGLPDELLPADWLGDRAAETFLRRYREVDGAAWRAWETLCADTAPDGRVPEHVASNLDVPAVRREPAGSGPVEEHPVDPPPDHRSTSPTTTRSRPPEEPVSTPAPSTAPSRDDDPKRTEEFVAALHAGHKVEPHDWMPSTYRDLNIRFIEMHANSEIMGALPEREWIARAPSLKRKRSLAAKVQDEVGHAHLIYRVAESLGRPRPAMYEDLISGRGKFHNVFHYPTYSWGDVACIGFLVDGAAIVTQRALLETSYAPYVRVMRRVVAEESLHYRHGEDIMLSLASGTDEQFEMLQEAVTRWWEPTMHFFGTDVSAEDDPMIHWGVKTRTNEESRQEWISQYVPKLWDMGIELPDPKLAYDPDAKTWDYTEPDWDRLKAIIKGEPTDATKSRLYWRQLMHRHHAWIHEIVTGDDLPAAAAA